MPLGPGARLGPYEIVSAIGAGGMGEVYRARDTRLKRDVALKILPASFATDPDRLARFQREAEVLASLNHPNIAAIYGLEEGPAEAGPYEAVGAGFIRPVQALVMELVEGETLADRIARGPISVDEALPIAKQIAEALEVAHEQGIIHRDLKPANIKVRADGTVKVLDFGLAKLNGPNVANDPNVSNDPNVPNVLSMSPTITSPALMTGVGVLLGTAAYMSPEQAKGKPADKRSDIWAFGCVVYEMLTGKRAFEGDDVSDTLAAVLRADPDWSSLPTETSASVAALLRRCVKKDRRERVGHISTALFVLTEPLTAPTRGATSERRQSIWRRASPLVAAGVAFAILGGLAGWNARRPESPSLTRFAVTLPQGQALPNQQVVAISPDGTQFAYLVEAPSPSSAPPTTQILLRSFAALESRVIVKASNASTDTFAALGSPFFSPDGQWIGFWSAVDSTLKKISVNGGPALTICKTDRPSMPVWNGTSIVFAVSGKGIMRVPADGGTPEIIAEVTSPQQMGTPQLLDGGRSLLFTLAPDSSDPARWDKAQIIVQSLASKERKVVVQRASDARYLSSGHLVYAVGSTLFAAPFDEKSGELLGNPTPVLEGVRRGTGAGVAHFSVSSNGTLVYVPGTASFGASDARQHLLATVDLDGIERRLSLPSQAYTQPRFSPDGRQLTVGTDDSTDAIVWVVDDLQGGGRLRRLTFEGNNRYPIWTSDGREVVFQSDRDENRGLFRQRADGSQPAQRLTTADSGTSHVPGAFTPDGRTLVFQIMGGTSGTSSIWTLSAGESRTTRVTESVEGYTPAFSPDGRWFVYSAVSDSGKAPNIFLQPFPPTGAKYQLTTTVGANPVWSPNGRQIFYEMGPREPWINAMDVRMTPGVTFGNRTRIALRNAIEQRLPYRLFDVSPDGKQFVVVLSGPNETTDQTQPATQIDVVMNWTEELRRRVPIQ